MREVSQALAARQQVLEEERDQRVLIEEAVDVTCPGITTAGARHPVTTVGERLSDVFVSMGYEIAEGPEIEAEWYNFDALNIRRHPAGRCRHAVRGGPDGERSGWCSGPTPRRSRSRDAHPAAPLYVVSPGRCYRNEAQDATHSPVFHQIECLAVDEA